MDDVGTAANVDARAEPRISQRASDAVARQVHFHDPKAPRADRVVPSAFVAVRDEQTGSSSSADETVATGSCPAAA